MCLAFREQTSKVIFQIRRPICKSAGQSDSGRLVGQFANWPDWQIVRNISKSMETFTEFQSNLRAEGTFSRLER